MSELKKKQYNTLNALKFIAAFFVVCIHVPFPGEFGKGVIAVARFAVPFFFMTSGFFSYYSDKEVLCEKYKRKIRHLLVIFAGSFLLYFAWDILGNVMAGTLKNYFLNKFSITAFAELLIFNHPRVMEALWFLPALIYATAMFFVFEKTDITKKLYFLIPLLFLAGVILREIPEFTENTPEIMTKAYLYRNWLFVGLPFFMLGHYIRTNEKRFTSKLSDAFLLVVMLVATAEAVAADLLHAQKSLYIGTFFAVAALFVLALKAEDKFRVPFLSKMGAEYSLYIYIFHIFVKNVIEKIGKLDFTKDMVAAVRPVFPLIVFAVTLIVSVTYVEIKKLLRKQEK